MSRQSIIDRLQLAHLRDPVFAELTEYIRKSLKSCVATLTLYGDKKAYILTLAVRPDVDPEGLEEFDVNRSMGIHAVNMERTLFIRDTKKGSMVSTIFAKGGLEVHSMAASPICDRNSNTMIGAFVCFHSEPTDFSEQYQEQFRNASSIVETLFNQLVNQQRSDDEINSACLYNAIQRIQKSQTFGDDKLIYQNALNDLLSITGCELGFIGEIHHDESNEACLVFRAMSYTEQLNSVKNRQALPESPFNVKDTLICGPLFNGEEYIINEPSAVITEEVKSFFTQWNGGVQNLVTLPLISKGEVCGIACLINRQHNFRHDFLDKLNVFLGVVAVSLQNERARFFSLQMEKSTSGGYKQDPLTGLPNFLATSEYVDTKIAKSNQPFTMIYLDIVSFSNINEFYSRAAGDLAIEKIANRLCETINPTDFVGRLSGDSFLLVINNHKDADYGTMLSNVLSEPFKIGDDAVSLDVRMGFVHAPIAGLKFKTLLKIASEAMHQSAIRNRVVVADIVEFTKNRKYSHLLEDLGHAVDQQQFKLYGLPTFDLNTGEIFSIEVLSRWQHPYKGILMPSDFMHIIESDINTQIKFDYNVIMRSISEIIERFEREEKIPHLCVNASPLLLLSESGNDLAEYIAELPEEVSKNICIEVVELNSDGNADAFREILKKFKSAGVRIALDDFGTGYSSLQRLAELPLDIIKIDRSFVAKMTSCAASESIVNSICSFCHRFDKIAIAEGIETEEQKEMLVKMGYRFGQGFLMQKPVPLDELI